MVTRTGDREIGCVSGRLPDNPGELACMTVYFFWIILTLKSFSYVFKRETYWCWYHQKIPPSIISSWAFPHRNRWSQVCSPQGFQPLFLSQHWPYFQYILLQVLQNHLATYERALIIPLVHVQPGFQVRRIKDDWQTFPKAMTKACKTWVFCSVWQYNNFSITLKKSTYIRCSLKRSILITCCLVHQQCTPTSSQLGVSQHGVHLSCEAN